MNRRLICWRGSGTLIRDRKQPSGRIAGRPAIVVMRMSSRDSRSRVLARDRQNFRQASYFGCLTMRSFFPRLEVFLHFIILFFPRGNRLLELFTAKGVSSG